MRFSGLSRRGLQLSQTGTKSLGYATDEDDMNQMEEHELHSGLIVKIAKKAKLLLLKPRKSLPDEVSSVLGGREVS